MKRIIPLFVITALFVGKVFSAPIVYSAPSGERQFYDWSELGSEAAKRSGGKGLGVTEMWNGYRLECRLQDLQAEVTMSGATILTTSESEGAGSFTIRTCRLGRGMKMKKLPAVADWMTMTDGVARIGRADIVEEYTTSGDGIRQDLEITQRPEGEGKLLLNIEIQGAAIKTKGEQAGIEVRFSSGRKLAYNALQVIDAGGRTLEARFEKARDNVVTIAVEDKNAMYPVRIDPTISDADWVSIGGQVPGVSGIGVGEIVLALAVDGSGNLYVGGYFTTAGGDTAANYIAKWDGSVWSALRSGTNGTVFSLAVDGSGNLYAGGSFTTAGGVAANYIARWDGSAWSALGSGTNSTVRTLAVDDSGNLYAGGDFDTAGGAAASRIARWDGSAWSALGSGMNGFVYALAVNDSGNLYAGGDFDTAGGVAASRIARWDGSGWSALESGMNGFVTALAVDLSGNLYAGGYFTSAGNAAVNNIARWNGSAWSPLGSGMSGGGVVPFVTNVLALAVDDSGSLYAGGRFTTAGGAAANYIARWDGSAWSALGSGLNGTVAALAVDGSGNLYAGGNFTTAGGAAANHIAKWDGSAWSALDNGTNNWVSALAVDDSGNLYAGGEFTTAGGTAANYIARWDGSAWSALGTGTNGRVSALAVDDSGNLYAGGSFTTAGGLTASRIAEWDRSAWSALGTGTNGTVYALAVDDSGILYVGGSFTTAGGLAVSRIAKWDGSAWSALGSGMGGEPLPYVYALAVDGSANLYAGGGFTIAGGKLSAYVAQCRLNTTAVMPRKGGNVSRPFLKYDTHSGLMRFRLKSPAEVSYRIYSLTGRSIFSASETMGAGSHAMRINTGRPARGTYIVHFKAGNESLRFRLVVDR